jgi:tight adherence protein C
MQNLQTLLSQHGNLVFLGVVFMSALLFSLALVNMTSSWFAVRRRATSTAIGGLELPEDEVVNLMGDNNQSGALDFVLPSSEKEKSALRQFMNLAGYYGTAATAIFQISRLLCAVLFGLITPFAHSALYPKHSFFLITLSSLVMTYFGYMLPRSIVSLQRDKLLEEHRIGFPDFLDLMVICVEAGIGMDAAIERIGTELGRSYPSLSRNLKFMSMEMRAGRATRDALENLGARLGIEEAKSFATLIMQSEELGSSLVQSLRVYSDEMRQKRMSRAEEKAQALPVKLVIPLGLFIFPVILGVTLFPIVLKLYKALGI